MPTGLVKSTIHASGSAGRTRSAMSSTTGTVRSALARPPAPVVSCPTQPHSRGHVSSLVPRRLAADPQLQQHGVGALHAVVEAAVVATVPGWPCAAKIRRARAADQVQPFLRRVHEDQLVDRQRVAQPGEPVDELGGVGRASADDGELHPLTPVRVTPWMKARWAKKNRMMTGAMTSRVAAMVRFQLTWWAPLNDSRP